MTDRRPRTVLFDWDNTLVESWGVIHRALNTTLAALGYPTWTMDQTRARVRKSAREAFPEWFGDDAGQATRIFYDAFEAEHLNGLATRPGAGDMLARLATHGYDLAVISNKRGDLLRREVQHLGWTAHFRALVGAGDAERDKPDAAAVAMALDGAPSRDESGDVVWLVGDTDVDLACAHNSGCIPILLREIPPESGEFGHAPPARYVAKCGDLVALLTGAC
jgi:phosphoglycolate phosphatase